MVIRGMLFFCLEHTHTVTFNFGDIITIILNTLYKVDTITY